jgi:cytidyltransferase-like protein
VFSGEQNVRAHRILGGIFDPVHNGHLAIASLAREFFGLQKVLFIPSGSPPHKDSVTASAEDRLAMLRLALKMSPVQRYGRRSCIAAATLIQSILFMSSEAV